MGTITEKMSYLKETKQAIRTAIEEKGVSVADTDTFRSYASKIGTISVGGGGTKWYVGDFYNGQMYEGNNGDLFLNTGTTDQGTIFQFQDGTWNPVGSLLGPQGEAGSDGTDGSIAPVGSIVIWGSEDIPENYLKCEGQILSREEYASLFNVIGTTFGDGDGTTTFALPDMRNYVVVGMSDDTNINAIGKKYGEKEVTLTVDEIPYLEADVYDTLDNKLPTGWNTGSANTNIIATTASENMGRTLKAKFNGGGQAHNNMQPSMAMVFIIKAYEITPADVNVVDSLDGNSTTDAPSVHAVNQKLQELTGGDDSWKDITLNSEFIVYEGGTSPKCRKKNGLVEIVGQIAPSANLPGSSTAVVIGTLPYGYAPNSTRYYICQGSGTNKWLFTVYANGNFGFSRYGVTQSIECTTENWLPFNVVYTIEDETTNILPQNYERSIATFALNGETYDLTNGTEAEIPLRIVYNLGTEISLSSDGYIEVADTVSHVLISGMVDITVDADGDYAARVDIDGENNWLMTTGQCSMTTKAGRRIHVSFSPVIMETGLIKKYRPKVTLTGGNGTIQYGANGRCNFTVEVLEHL